jgi:hypothetical protein
MPATQRYQHPPFKASVDRQRCHRMNIWEHPAASHAGATPQPIAEAVDFELGTDS